MNSKEQGVELTTIAADCTIPHNSICGPLDRIVRRPASLKSADSSDLSFCTRLGDEAIELLSTSKAGVVIVHEDLNWSQRPSEVTVIHAANPRLLFTRIAQLFERPRLVGIHPSAVIDPAASIDATAYVGANCTIGVASIGPGSVIHSNVSIYDNVRIGANVTVHAGTVIGADGFGYERSETGEMVKFPHFGGVLIEDDVEIGSNVSIDRGSLDETLIKKGAKIDNQVHVAHNTEIGESAVVIAHAMIGGSTRIGDRAWVAPSACLRDKIVVGDDSIVGLASLVTKNVARGESVAGSPARPLDEQKRLLAKFRELVR